MKRQLLILLLGMLTVALPAVAKDDIKRVKATYEYKSDDTKESVEDARAKAIQRAKEKALEENFGLRVTSVKTSVQTHKVQDSKADVESNFLDLSENTVAAEWVEIIEEKILKEEFKNGFWTITASVDGRARELKGDKADIRFTVLNGRYGDDKFDYFYNDDFLYLRFSSPVSGKVCVYLMDTHQDLYCLLPYERESGSRTVEANTEYVFFNEEDFSMYNPRSFVGYRMTCEGESEQNVLYVIFSPDALTKANDLKAGNEKEPMPRMLSFKDFQAWLTRNRTLNPNLVVKQETITILNK